MRLLITLLALFVTLFTSGQTFNEKQGVSIASGSKGFAEYLPAGYDQGTFPAVIFLHGVGERGNGTNELFKVSSIGPTSYVKWTGWKPDVIMIAPQWLNPSTWPSPDMVDQVVNYVLANYRVDKNRIYLTGLSMGGGASWDYASSSVARSKKLAALLPVCGYSGSWAGAKPIADAQLPTFATHNNGDPQVPYSMSVNWVNSVNAAGLKPPAQLRTFISTTHNAWDSTYNPAIKVYNGNLNWLEWMLQYSRGSVTPPPVVVPPIDPEPPQNIMIIPTDERFLKVTKGWAQTSTDIYGSSKTISGTSFQAFYNAERWGLFSYQIPVPVGTYTVRLYFAELFWSQPSQRIFNVAIEGAPVLTNFDIIASVGKFTALQRDFQTTVNDGILNINFTAVKDNAKITGIEIIPGEIRTIRKITELQDSATNKILSRDTTYQR